MSFVPPTIVKNHVNKRKLRAGTVLQVAFLSLIVPIFYFACFLPSSFFVCFTVGTVAWRWGCLAGRPEREHTEWASKMAEVIICSLVCLSLCDVYVLIKGFVVF